MNITLVHLHICGTGIHLQTYAQKNPMDEYKRQSFDMFNHMLHTITYEVISKLHLLRPDPEANTNRPQNYAIETISVHYDDSKV